MIKSGENILLTEDAKNEMRINAEKAYGEFLTALGYDWQNDPNMKGTPRRVAKMYVDEVTSGAYTAPPKITSFANEGRYDAMVFQGNISVKSLCSHHMQPFVGKAHVAYIPKKDGVVIGLSKLNRIVEWFARRPQLQEQLTQQIHDYIDRETHGNLGVAVYIECQHMCVSLRGVNDDSTMKTIKLSGVFMEPNHLSREEFYHAISNLKR